MSATQLLELSQRHENLGGAFLGSIVLWNLHECRVLQDELKQLATAERLPEKYLPKPISAHKAFTAATNATRKSLPDGMLLRPLGSSDTEFKLALVSELKNAEDEVYDTVHLLTIRFDKINHVIDSSASHEQVEELKKWFTYYQEYTLKDVRSLLNNFTSECAVPLRNSGGIYYVPANYQHLVEALDKILKQLHPANQVLYLKQFDAPHNRQELIESAMERIEQEVKDLEGELSERFGGSEDSVGTHEGTLKRRLVAYEDLKKRVGVFAKTLSFNSDKLMNRLNTCQELVRQKLLGIDTFVPIRVEVEEKPVVPEFKQVKQPTPVAVSADDVGF